MEKWMLRAQKMRRSLEFVASLSFVLMAYANWRTHVDGENMDWVSLWFLWGIGFLVLLFTHKMLRATVQRAQLPKFSGDKWSQLALLNSEIAKMQEIVDLRNSYSKKNLEEQFGCSIYLIAFLFGIVTVAGFLVHAPNSFDSVGIVWISFNLMVLGLFIVGYVFFGVTRKLWKSHEEELVQLLNAKAHELENLAKDELLAEVRESTDAVSKLIELHQLPLPRIPRNSRDFEILVSQWLQAWGDTEVVVTKATGDSGLDVLSANCAAQVKFFADNKVGRPDVQSLKGAASVFPALTPAFFAYASGYTSEAVSWASANSVALFVFDVDTSEFESLNDVSRTFRKSLLSKLLD